MKEHHHPYLKNSLLVEYTAKKQGMLAAYQLKQIFTNKPKVK